MPYPVLDYTGWHVVLTLDPAPYWDSYEEELFSVARLYTAPDKSGYVPLEEVSPYGEMWALEWPAEEAFSATFYVEALALGEFRFKLELREPGWGILDSDAVVFTALAPDGEVKLTIFDGQDGAEVIDEDGGGAVTVANKNDTDFDNIIDNVDHTGGATGGNGVEETRTGADKHGRNEVDLMRLIVHKPKSYAGPEGPPIILTVTPANRVRLWGDKLKKTAIDATTYDPESGVATWTSWAGADKTIWVEITSESSTVADVELKLEYSTFDPDIVKATGVWAANTLAKWSTAECDDLAGTVWREDMDDKLQKEVRDKYGGSGPRPVVPIIVGGAKKALAVNVALLQFTVTPADVETKLPRVKFDLTRSRWFHAWKTTFADPTWKEDGDIRLPRLREDPNDDIDDHDESDKVNAMGHMYVIDAPGIFAQHPAVDTNRMWAKNNFFEFARVKFNGSRPTGGSPDVDDTSGSIASLRYMWSSESAIIWDAALDPDRWRHTTEEEGGKNLLLNEWIEIGNVP